MDSIAAVISASLLGACIICCFFYILGAGKLKTKRVSDLSFGSIDRQQVLEKYYQYSSFFHNPKEIEKTETVPAVVDIFYNLVTDMYEYLWGQSFHFSPPIPGKSDIESATIHELNYADSIAVKPGQKILDVGCGIGGPMRAIAAHSGCNVVGITINEYQANQAKARNKNAGLEKKCEVVCGNFLEMPFEDESFDGAYSIDATCHAPTLEDVYREVFRVLKPGSMYVSQEWVTTESYQDENPEHVEIIKGIERGNALPGLRSYADVVQAAKKVGFEVVREKDLAKPPAEPWWRRLKKQGGVTYWRKHVVVMVLERLGFVPQGTVDVHEMLFKMMKHLVNGAETGIFSPMHMILCKKPMKPQPA